MSDYNEEEPADTCEHEWEVVTTELKDGTTISHRFCKKCKAIEAVN